MAAKKLRLKLSPIQLCISDNIEVVEFSVCCCMCLCVLSVFVWIEITADSLGAQNCRLCVRVLCTWICENLCRDTCFTSR